MIYYSKIYLLAHVITDPVLRQAGKTLVATFHVGLSRRRHTPDKPEPAVNQLFQVEITAFNEHAQRVGQFVRRGLAVFIEGHFGEHLEQTAEPLRRHVTKLDVVIDECHWLTSRTLAFRLEEQMAFPPAPQPAAVSGN